MSNKAIVISYRDIGNSQIGVTAYFYGPEINVGNPTTREAPMDFPVLSTSPKFKQAVTEAVVEFADGEYPSANINESDVLFL